MKLEDKETLEKLDSLEKEHLKEILEYIKKIEKE